MRCINLRHNLKEIKNKKNNHSYWEGILWWLKKINYKENEHNISRTIDEICVAEVAN